MTHSFPTRRYSDLQSLANAHRKTVRIGDEQVIADKLNRAANAIRQELPSFEIVLCHAVLDRLDRIGGNQIGEIIGHLSGSQRRAFPRSDEHTSELQSLMRISYAVFCLKKKK